MTGRNKFDQWDVKIFLKFKKVHVLKFHSAFTKASDIWFLTVINFCVPLFFLPTVLVKIFWNFTAAFWCRSAFPQVKRNLRYSITNLVYELPREFSNDFRILGN